MDIIFDLDGTLANIDHRLHYIKTKPKNWDAFFASVIYDRPNDSIVEVCKDLARAGNRIIISSGRSDVCEAATVEWLEEVGITYDAIYMRPKNLFIDDADLKRRMLGVIRQDGFDPVLVFDDRQRVVDMWRSEGLTCCQVAKGDF